MMVTLIPFHRTSTATNSHLCLPLQRSRVHPVEGDAALPELSREGIREKRVLRVPPSPLQRSVGQLCVVGEESC